MPDMDGIRMAAQIKVMNPGMKFIVLSGHSEQYYLDKLSEIGITDYMLKPVDTNKLFLLIGKFIDQVRREHRVVQC
jgi:two-component system response regulator YesN